MSEEHEPTGRTMTPPRRSEAAASEPTASTARPVSRRTALRISLGAGAAVASGSRWSRAGAQATPVVPSAGATTPTAGMIPGGAPGVPDAYTALPTPFKSTSGPPGSGGTVSCLVISYGPPPPGRDENAFWQELEKRLNVTWEPTIVPADNYREKLATTLAGGEIPDLTFVSFGNAPDQIQAIQQSAYLDQTAFLTPEKLEDYPNLKLIPSYAWDNSRVDGKIYGVPSPLAIPNYVLLWRPDWAARVGVLEPANAADFKQTLVGMTQNDPNGNGQPDTFGLGAWATASFNVDTLAGMFRVPNGWRQNPDGTLTNAVETEEFRQLVSYLRELQKAGVYHPDTLTFSISQAKDGYIGSRFGGYSDGIYGFPEARKRILALDPEAAPGIWTPPGHDGGPGVTHNSPGYFGIAAMPARLGDDPEKVEELLRILDYLAAPFDSEEWLFRNNGLEGVHYTLREDGVPVPTEQGQREIGPLTGVASALPALFYDVPGTAEVMQQAMRRHVAIGIDDPTARLFSPANAARNGELSQLRTDSLSAIITGREPLAALDQYVAAWRSRGGDEIRREYEEGLRQGG